MKIDLNQFANSFRAKIQSDITALNIIQKQKDQKDIFNSKLGIKFNAIDFMFDTPPYDYLEKREIIKTFKSVVAALQDFLDELIATIKITERIPIYVLKPDELGQCVHSTFKKVFMEVITDTRINTTQKLEFILDKVNQQQNIVLISLQSLFYVRNGFEHHKGLAKIDRELTYKRIALVTTSGKEVTKPGPLEPGEGLNMSVVNELIKYDEGNEILITSEQLHGIITNLFMLSIDELKNAAQQKIG